MNNRGKIYLEQVKKVAIELAKDREWSGRYADLLRAAHDMISALDHAYVDGPDRLEAHRDVNRAFQAARPEIHWKWGLFENKDITVVKDTNIEGTLTHRVGKFSQDMCGILGIGDAENEKSANVEFGIEKASLFMDDRYQCHSAIALHEGKWYYSRISGGNFYDYILPILGQRGSALIMGVPEAPITLPGDIAWQTEVPEGIFEELPEKQFPEWVDPIQKMVEYDEE